MRRVTVGMCILILALLMIAMSGCVTQQASTNNTTAATNTTVGIATVTVTATAGPSPTATPVSTPSPTATTAPSPTPTTMTVIINNYAFTPQTLTVPTGTTVMWMNQDTGVPHTITSDDGRFTSSGTINSGGSYQYQFMTPGTYAYHCSIHPQFAAMHAAIVVT